MKTVTSLFHSEQHATAAMSRLEQAGIPRDCIDIWSTPHNLNPVLEDAGVSASDAHAYTEGVRRGGSVVIVKCDDAGVDRAVNILDQEGVLDLDEQQASWRREGWQGYEAPPSSAPATGLTGNITGLSGAPSTREGDITGSPDVTEAKTDSAFADTRDETAPVGRRPLEHGRFRIQSYVVVKRSEKE